MGARWVVEEEVVVAAALSSDLEVGCHHPRPGCSQCQVACSYH